MQPHHENLQTDLVLGQSWNKIHGLGVLDAHLVESPQYFFHFYHEAPEFECSSNLQCSL